MCPLTETEGSRHQGKDRLPVIKLTMPLATLLAMGGQSIYELVELASAFVDSGFFVVGCFAAFSRIGGSATAYTGYLVVLVVWAYRDFAAGWTAPFLVSLACSLAAYLLVARLKSARKASSIA